MGRAPLRQWIALGNGVIVMPNVAQRESKPSTLSLKRIMVELHAVLPTEQLRIARVIPAQVIVSVVGGLVMRSANQLGLKHLQSQHLQIPTVNPARLKMVSNAYVKILNHVVVGVEVVGAEAEGVAVGLEV